MLDGFQDLLAAANVKNAQERNKKSELWVESCGSGGGNGSGGSGGSSGGDA